MLGGLSEGKPSCGIFVISAGWCCVWKLLDSRNLIGSPRCPSTKPVRYRPGSTENLGVRMTVINERSRR